MYKHLCVIAFAMIALLSCGQKKDTTMGDKKVENRSVADESSIYLLVGTYTTGESKGIYVYQFDTISGNSKYLSMVKVDNPSYLTITKDERFVYSVTENEDQISAANSFSFDKKKGELKLINTQPTQGGAPCFISVDNEGKHIITANYLGGSVSVFPINSNGSLSEVSQVISFTGKGIDAERQNQPHLHCVKFSPDEKYLFAEDLGTDKIFKFNVNKDNEGDFLIAGEPESFKVADGVGPRHLVFHPNQKYAYLITEMGGTVIGFNYENGNLKEFQTIEADTLHAKGSGDIRITPDGKFLYASNRLKSDGIAIFSINASNGRLSKVGYQETGVHPRNIMVTPNGKFLLVACRDNDIIQIYEIDKATGMLTNTYKDIQLDMPVCLVFASFK